jgi:hypothetical protein
LKEYDETFTYEKIKRINVVGKQDAIMKPDDDSKENKKLEGLVVGVKGANKFDEKYNYVDNFIHETHKRPNKNSKNLFEKSHGKWLCEKLRLYYKNKLSKYENLKIEKLLQKYKNIIITSTELCEKIFNNVIKIYENENRLPNNNKSELNYRRWYFYNKKKLSYNKIIYNNDLTDKIRTFIDKTSYLIIDNDTIWEQKYIKNYNLIKSIKQRPTSNEGNWITRQLGKYKNNKLKQIQKIKIEKMLNDFEEYFQNNEDIWNIIYEKVDTFLEQHKRRPKLEIVCEKVFANWINTQNRKLRKNNCIMKQQKFKEKYLLLKHKHGILLLDNNEKWYYRLEQLEEFVKTKNIKPTASNCPEDIFVYYSSQIFNYRHNLGKMTKNKNGSESKNYIHFRNLCNKYKHLNLI